MKIISVRNTKSKLGRVVDQVIKTREPIVIPRGENQVMIAPDHLPTPDEMELIRIGKEMDQGHETSKEDEELSRTIQAEIREYRVKKKPQK